MNLEVFAGIDVWASNRAYLLLDRVSWTPAYWVAVDRRVVPDIASELAAIHDTLDGTTFFYPDTFLGLALGEGDNLFWLRERRPYRPIAYDFSFNVPSYVATSATVTVTALQLAVHLGYNPIYLIGCDTAYTVPNTVYRKTGTDALTSTEDDDRNHFDPRYFGRGRHWHDPHVPRMIDNYRAAHARLTRHGTSVFNATVGGNLEVFPRIDYQTLSRS